MTFIRLPVFRATNWNEKRMVSEKKHLDRNNQIAYFGGLPLSKGKLDL